MTFTDHMLVWNGLKPDLDGAYGNQCMDEMHLYIIEVLGLINKKILSASGPKEIWNNWNNITGHEFFEKIENTPTAIPQEEDIVIWTWGTYGHVGIFVSGDIKRFQSFEQNYPVSGDPCHVQEHNYTSVAGWLRCIKPSVDKELENCVNDRNNWWDTIIWCCDKLGIPHSVDLLKTEIEKFIKVGDIIRQKEKENEELKIKIKDLEVEIEDISFKFTEQIEKNGDLEESLKKLTEEVEIGKKSNNELGVKLSAVLDSLERLKKDAVKGLSGWELIKRGFKKVLSGGE